MDPPPELFTHWVGCYVANCSFAGPTCVAVHSFVEVARQLNAGKINANTECERRRAPLDTGTQSARLKERIISGRLSDAAAVYVYRQQRVTALCGAQAQTRLRQGTKQINTVLTGAQEADR